VKYAQSTPGPWHASTSGNGILSGSTWVVHNSPKGEEGVVIDNPYDRALIAAAPTMKQAIDSFIACQCYNRATPGNGICKDCWRLLNRASERAEV
jgi:hypothetical protein